MSIRLTRFPPLRFRNLSSESSNANHFVSGVLRNNYLRSFVIGSCFFVVLPFFLAVDSASLKIAKYIPFLKLLDPSKRNYSYEQYSFIAPVFLGMANAVSLYIVKYFEAEGIQYNVSSASRYLVLSLFVPTFVLWFSYTFGMYNYTSAEWMYYAALIYLAHFAVWNYLVAYLERNV